MTAGPTRPGWPRSTPWWSGRTRRSAGLWELDQERVDAIVDAMVRAGVRAAVDLARVAIEETGFGVFEDKVVKNYVATEFLADYLRGKRSVGVVEEDVERNIVRVAEPVGVVLAITPVTNPTSTVLYKAIVAAKTRNAVLFRPSPLAVGCCSGASRWSARRERPPGCRRARSRWSRTPPRRDHHLLRHPLVDFVWVTGGPKIVAIANASRKPRLSVGPGNAPIYIHRSADLRAAVVDILISKTFDASVICPAEQTAVVDDEVYDATVAEFERMGAQVLTAEETERLADFVFGDREVVNVAALGQQAPELARRAGITVEPTVKLLIAPLPTTSPSSTGTRWCARS